MKIRINNNTTAHGLPIPSVYEALDLKNGSYMVVDEFGTQWIVEHRDTEVVNEPKENIDNIGNHKDENCLAIKGSFETVNKVIDAFIDGKIISNKILEEHTKEEGE